MPITPDPPFPKAQGDFIRSKDWNDAINEVIRLDQAKLNLTGGRLTGSLTVSGPLGIGTPPTTRAHGDPGRVRSLQGSRLAEEGPRQDSDPRHASASP